MSDQDLAIGQEREQGNDPGNDPGKEDGRDHSMFDAELSGAVLNMQLFGRIIRWLVPYRLSLLVSGVLVLIASCSAVVMEIVISRVLVD